MPARTTSEMRPEPLIVRWTEHRGGPWLTAMRALVARDSRAAAVTAIAMGGCPFSVGPPMAERAHAHIDTGWVCFRSRRLELLVTERERASRLLIHEVAHIVSGEYHTPAWAEACIHLGAPSEAARQSDYARWATR